MRLFPAICLATAGLAADASATEVLFTTGNAANANGATLSDANPLTIQPLNSFVLENDSLVTRAAFAGNYNGERPPSSDIFQVVFYNDVGGVPDFNNFFALTAETVFVDDSQTGFQNLAVDIDPGLPLDSGVIYWISVIAIDAEEDFFWASRSGSQGTSLFIGDRATGQISPPQVANRSQIFTLEGIVVPEPGSTALLALGAAAIAGRRRRAPRGPDVSSRR